MNRVVSSVLRTRPVDSILRRISLQKSNRTFASAAIPEPQTKPDILYTGVSVDILRDSPCWPGMTLKSIFVASFRWYQISDDDKTRLELQFCCDFSLIRLLEHIVIELDSSR